MTSGFLSANWAICAAEWSNLHEHAAKCSIFLGSFWDPSQAGFRSVSWAYLGMEGAAAAATWGEEVDDDELVAGVEQGVGEVLRGLDLPHVGLQPLVPPPRGLGKRQVHLSRQKERA